MADVSYDDILHPRHATTYICVDEAPEIGAGLTARSESTLAVVEVDCDTLPCSTYPQGRELACVVCTK